MKNILIVVKGPDGSGKTTLIEQIMQEIPGLEYQKPVPSKGPSGISLEETLNWMATRFVQVIHGSNQIFDRIDLISELIYGPICRGKSRFENGEHIEL